MAGNDFAMFRVFAWSAIWCAEVVRRQFLFPPRDSLTLREMYPRHREHSVRHCYPQRSVQICARDPRSELCRNNFPDSGGMIVVSAKARVSAHIGQRFRIPSHRACSLLGAIP